MLRNTPLIELVDRIRQAIPQDTPIYMVGGAIRDALIGRPVHDIDFILPENALQIARQVANAFKGDYYPLDTERETARLIQVQPDGSRLFIDFARLRGPDLESDLRERDFTINAMAVDLRQMHQLIDPLGGSQDLHDRIIRTCSEDSLLNDPLRTLRAVRLAISHNSHILAETRQKIRQALPLLPGVSPERVRDELFRILDGPQPATAINALEILGGLPYIFPELSALKGVNQSPPHTQDVWLHTLDVVQRLQNILNVLSPQPNPEINANWTMGLISVRLGRYRQQLNEHLSTSLNPGRSLRALILLAALYHDSGKPPTRQTTENGSIRFLEHEEQSTSLISDRARKLHLSNDEIERLKTIVRNHMRPLQLAQTGNLPTRRAIYRFFRATGSAGVDICLHALADTLATYLTTLPEEIWIRQLDVSRTLLEAWWEKPAENVSPPPLISGSVLIDKLNLQPGPVIGKLLETIQEAQAAGEINTPEEALELAKATLEKL